MNIYDFFDEVTRGINIDSKHFGVWHWLSSCPLFDSLFFVFSNDDSGDVAIVPLQTVKDEALKSYVNKTYLRAYDMTLSYVLPIARAENTPHDIDYLNRVEQLSAWVEEQDNNKNYPTFGDGYEVQKVEVLTGSDGIAAIGEDAVQYKFNVRIEYFDTTKKRGL